MNGVHYTVWEEEFIDRQTRLIWKMSYCWLVPSLMITRQYTVHTCRNNIDLHLDRGSLSDFLGVTAFLRPVTAGHLEMVVMHEGCDNEMIEMSGLGEEGRLHSIFPSESVTVPVHRRCVIPHLHLLISVETCLIIGHCRFTHNPSQDKEIGKSALTEAGAIQ